MILTGFSALVFFSVSKLFLELSASGLTSIGLTKTSSSGSVFGGATFSSDASADKDSLALLFLYHTTKTTKFLIKKLAQIIIRT